MVPVAWRFDRSGMAEIQAELDQLFRRESGQILAGLIRIARSFDLGEEALQDAFAAALAHWETNGLPDNPAAWLTTVAQRRLLDILRKRQTQRAKEESLRYETPTASFPELEEPVLRPCPDERLSLIFTCCHPALGREAQIALTLRTLCGLTTPEIARAFLIPESSLAQRIVRAKSKIQEAGIPYEVPPPSALAERLFSVRAVLYLIFNEGYSSTNADSWLRRELSSEAIRLTRLLSDLMPQDAENLGLLALMLLQDSRRDSRLDAEGGLVLLDQQDRKRWDRLAIEEGLAVLDRAIQLRCPGPYQLQAAVAALHAQAPTAADTDWRQIATLYGELARVQPSATVMLNSAVALAMAEGPAVGLAALERANLDGALSSYYLFHSAKADFFRRLGKREEAAAAYRAALHCVTNPVERRFLESRLHEVCI